MRKLVLIGMLAVIVMITGVARGGNVEGESSYYYDRVNTFFSKIKTGNVAEAVDFIYSDNQWVMKKPDAVQNLKNQFINAENLVGKYQNHVKLLEKSVADRFVYLYYFVAYDRQPLRFVFEFYKAKDKWMLFSFSFDADIDDEIEEKAKSELFQ